MDKPFLLHVFAKNISTEVVDVSIMSWKILPSVLLFFLSCLQFLFSVHFSSEAGAATYLEKIFADKIVWFLLKVKHFLEHDYFVEMEHRGLAL